ncbi:MAG TPA: TMEM43 family protein [Rhodanobacter sp.]|nr:TMEM43 family protein [Rhodanobacter sp.]
MRLYRGMSWRLLVINVVGTLLVLAGVGMEALNASNLIAYREASGRHGGEVIELGQNAQPQAGQHGYMARVVGTPKVVEAPHDRDFNQTWNTPVLVRHVEMFQWREIAIGDNVHYELDWVDHPLDASHFKDPQGHGNPGEFPVSSEQFDASLVQIGGFKLGRALVRALPGSKTIEPDAAALPYNLAATFSRHQSYLVSSAQPGNPRLGDLRVSWTGVPLQQVTVVARLDGARLDAASDAGDGKGYQVQVGDVPVLDMFPDLPVPPKFVMIWRVLGVLLAALGAFVLLPPQRRRQRVLPALGLGATAVGSVASVVWLSGGNGALLGGWLVVTLAGIALSVWCLRRRSGSGNRH